MSKIWMNTRTELHSVELDGVAYMKADGNYTDIYYVDGHKKSEVACLSAFEKAIKHAYANRQNPFYRLGRSLLLNTSFLIAVNVQKHVALFNASPPIVLSLSKVMASQLKAYLLENLQHDSAIMGSCSGTISTDSDKETFPT